MTLAINGAVTINDSVAFKEQVFTDLLRSAKVHAPVLEKYMKAVPEMGSKLQWFQQALEQGTVQLNGAYTAGDATMTIDAPTTVNPFVVYPGSSQVMTEDGGAVYDITAVNDAQTLITITFSVGTDVNLTDNTELFLVMNDDIGSDFGAQNNAVFASSDINFVGNMSDTLRIANPIADGRFLDLGFNEGSFEHQVSNNLPRTIRALERRVIKDIRTAGSNANTSNGFTRTAGTGSRPGGIVSFINSGGGFTPTNSTPIGEDVLEADMIALRDRGAFTQITDRTRNMTMSTVDAYISEETLGDINKLVRLERAPEIFLEKKMNGTAGTWVTSFTVNGVIIDFNVSDGMTDSEILYIPRAEDVEIPVLRLYEEQPEDNAGDNTKKMYTTTFSVKASRPFLMGHRTNLTRL